MNRRGASIWKTHWPSLGLVAADVLGFAGAWWAAWHLRAVALAQRLGPINEFDPYLALQPLVVAVGIANCALFGLYRTRRRLSSLTNWGAMLRTAYHYLLYMMVVGYFFKELDLGRSVIFLAAALSTAWLWASRSAFRALKASALRRGTALVRAAIVGTGPLAREVDASLRGHREVGFEILGFIRHPDDPMDTPAPSMRIMGESTEIEAIVRDHGIEELFVAVPHLTTTEQLNLINLGATPGLRLQLVTNMFGVIAARAKVDEVAAFPVVTLRDGHLPRPQAFVKRAFDIAVAALGTVAWMLFFHWWIALWIRRDSKGPVFFKQERVGRDGRTFTCWKYRTMRVDAQAYAVAPTASDDPRVTSAGRWLRKTSLDELPQLLNVLDGSMSMVGPRPEMPFIVEQYEEWQKRRLDVKPGITGLWQVIGRKNLPLHLNMQYDFYYIMNQSLMLDVEILIRTVPAVLKGRGAF